MSARKLGSITGWLWGFALLYWIVDLSPPTFYSLGVVTVLGVISITYKELTRKPKWKRKKGMQLVRAYDKVFASVIVTAIYFLFPAVRGSIVQGLFLIGLLFFILAVILFVRERELRRNPKVKELKKSIESVDLSDVPVKVRQAPPIEASKRRTSRENLREGINRL